MTAKVVRKGKAPMTRGRGDLGKGRIGTHWADCHEVHHDCALARLEQARAELEFQMELVAEAGAAISLARRWLEKQGALDVDGEEALQGLRDWEDRNDVHEPPDGVAGT